MIYFPPDLELPPFVSHSLGVIEYLKKFKYVKAVRLRGQVSMGIALPLNTPGFEKLISYFEQEYWSADQHGEGTDVDWYFGTKRFVPVLNESIKRSMGREIQSHPLLFKYTDIERLEKHRYSFNADEEVVITEKIHGTNVRIACIAGQVMVGSHNTQRELPGTPDEAMKNFYWFPISIPGVERLIKELGKDHQQVILFGETYGKGVQGGFSYGKEGLAFAAFDLMLDGNYVDYPRFISLMTDYDVPSVPIDYTGPYTEDVVELFRDAPSWFTRDQIREGVVIKPRFERTQGRLGRLILKAINPEYSVRKSAGKVEDNPIV